MDLNKVSTYIRNYRSRIICLLCLTALALPLSLWATSIEYGNFDYNNHGWTLLDGGGGKIILEQSDQAFQARGVRSSSDGPHTLTKTIDTTGYTTIQVFYWTNGNGMESADLFQAQWSGDGGQTWATFQTLTGNVYDDTWVLWEVTLSGAGNNPDFTLRFIFDGDHSSDEWYFDELMVLGDGELLDYGDFGGTFNGWTATDGGSGSIELSQLAHHDFQMHAYGSGAHQLFKRIDTSGLLDLQLSYYIRGNGLEAADTFTVEWSADGSITWNLLQTLDGQTYKGSPANIWREQSFALPATAGNNRNFVLRFTFDGDHNSDDWYIDEVVLDGDNRAVSQVSLTSDSPTSLGQATTLTAQVSGEALSYQWNFGDGSPVVTTSDPIVSHAYPKAGGYTASVTVYATLNSKSASTVISIKDVPPAGLTLTANDPTPVGQLTAFTATVSAGTGLTYTWDFGDGTPLVTNGPEISHTYANPGTYTVTVTASNTEGSVSTTIDVVIEALPPVPAPVAVIYLPVVQR